MSTKDYAANGTCMIGTDALRSSASSLRVVMGRMLRATAKNIWRASRVERMRTFVSVGCCMAGRAGGMMGREGAAVEAGRGHL